MASSTRIFMIGLFVLIFSVFLYFQFGLSDVKPGDRKSQPPPSPAKSSAAPARTPVDLPVDLNKITCPVCGKIVNPANAARKERFYDRILYFDSEKCYQEFLKDPIKYSKQLKVKIDINIKPAPLQLQPESSPEQYFTPRSPGTSPDVSDDPDMIPKEDILEEIPLDGIVPDDGQTPMVEELP